MTEKNEASIARLCEMMETKLAEKKKNDCTVNILKYL